MANDPLKIFAWDDLSSCDLTNRLAAFKSDLPKLSKPVQAFAHSALRITRFCNYKTGNMRHICRIILFISNVYVMSVTFLRILS